MSLGCCRPLPSGATGAPAKAHQSRPGRPVRIRLRVFIPAGDEQCPSLTSLWPTANFQEREMFDFFGNWTISERVALRFGVDNLLDEDPEIVNQVPNTNDALGSTLPDYYDILGRRAYVGVRWNF